MNKPRVVIVTGGGTGMGKAIAKLFAANGDKVYILGRTKSKLDQTATELGVRPFVVDLTKPKEVEATVKAITSENETIDVLVNCAGGSANAPPGLSLAEAFDLWRAGIDQNLSSAFLMIYALRTTLTRPGGRIINVSSLAAFAGSSRVGGEVYAASKAALHGMMRSMVKEFAPIGITINAVAPGLIGETDFFGSNGIDKDRLTSALKTIPTGRIGDPDEVAHAVFYLASSEASFVNGDILNINGGAQFSR